MQKVIGYVRVSTIGQAVEGISIDNQIEKIKGYCTLNDLNLIRIIRDEGISAKNLSGRPKAQIMIQQAIKSKSGLVVYKLDRMFRNTIDALTTINQLDKAGVSFHSINEKLDTTSAMGKFFTTMLAALAELERNVISERTRDALQNKKAQGQRIGTVPYGWSLAADQTSLIPNEYEQSILQIIRCLRVQHKSFQGIATHLNLQGHTTRTGGPFQKQNVHQIFTYSARHEALVGGIVNQPVG